MNHIGIIFFKKKFQIFQGYSHDDNPIKCHHVGNYSKAVIPESGHMYCLECIIKFLIENGYCPITKIPADVHNLIRIYSPV